MHSHGEFSDALGQLRGKHVQQGGYRDDGVGAPSIHLPIVMHSKPPGGVFKRQEKSVQRMSATAAVAAGEGRGWGYSYQRGQGAGCNQGDQRDQRDQRGGGRGAQY